MIVNTMLKKMYNCRELLDPPAPDVVAQLINEINRIKVQRNFLSTIIDNACALDMHSHEAQELTKIQKDILQEQS